MEGMVKQWLLPAFGALIVWGFSGFIPKLTIRYIGPKSAMIYESLGVITMALIVLCSLEFKPDIHPRGILLAITSGALAFSGQLLFYHSILRGPVSLIAIFSGLYPIVTVLLAVIFLQEPISLKHGLGIVLGLLSMALIASP
jgi:bacterial/archaeal transporter family protein